MAVTGSLCVGTAGHLIFSLTPCSLRNSSSEFLWMLSAYPLGPVAQLALGWSSIDYAAICLPARFAGRREISKSAEILKRSRSLRTMVRLSSPVCREDTSPQPNLTFLVARELERHLFTNSNTHTRNCSSSLESRPADRPVNRTKTPLQASDRESTKDASQSIESRRWKRTLGR
jgi:hypothetical protein